MNDEIEREATEKISVLLNEAELKLSEAAEIADKAGIDFSWSGPAYGMGGSYWSKKEAKEDLQDSGYSRYEDDEGWISSSSQC